MTVSLSITDGDLPRALETVRRRPDADYVVRLTPGETYEIDAPIQVPFGGFAIVCDGGLWAADVPGVAAIRYAGDVGADGMLVFQGGRGLRLDGLRLVGPNPVALTGDIDELLDDTTFVPDGSVNPKFSCLAVDPAPRGSGLASSRIEASRCSFEDSRIGIGVSLSGDPATQNAESFRFRECSIKFCEVAYAAGQAQSKECAIVDSNIYGCKTAIDCTSYGQGLGYAPVIRGGSVGAVRELARFESSVSPLYIHQLYAEFFVSLGRWDVSASSANGVASVQQSDLRFFRSTMVDDYIAANGHLMTHASCVSFSGCAFHWANPVAPLRFSLRNGGSNLSTSFRDSVFLTDLPVEPVQADLPDRVSYDRCMVRDTTGNGTRLVHAP